MKSTQPHHPRPHAKQLQLWQLIVFAYMVWPGLSIRITLNVTPLQVKFFWNHQFWCVLGVRAVTDAFSSFCLLAEIQSYGLRPPSRFQVLLCFGDECLDPQRQRRTLTVQVTAAPEFHHWLWSRDLSFFCHFVSEDWWSLIFTGKLTISSNWCS